MTLLVPQPGPLALPEPSPESRPYWEAADRGELVFQRCGECGAAVFVPAAACRWCLAPDLAWEASAGRGALYSWTVVRRPPTADFTVPYAPAIVDLDEGYRMLTNVIGCDTEDLAVGMRLRVRFVRVAPDRQLPCFEPDH